MGEARRRKLAGSGPVPPKERNIRVGPIIGHIGRGRSNVLSAIALMMSMEQNYPMLPTKRERGIK